MSAIRDFTMDFYSGHINMESKTLESEGAG